MTPVLRHYAVCRACAEVYPTGGACPACTSPVRALKPRGLPAVARGDAWLEPPSSRVGRVATALLGVALGAGLLLILAALSQA